jgi:glycerophosphoryl diester phosphodiesterase
MRALPLLRYGLGAALACCLMASMAPAAPAAVMTASGRTFLVLAHRGNGAGAYENSVQAYTAAGVAGYDGIETDIQFSSDHVAVMSHSDSLKPGNAGGSDCMLPDQPTTTVKIHQTSAADLQRVRCKDADGAYTVPLATFADLVTVLMAYPQLQLTLDVKKYSGASAKAQRDYAKRAAKLIIANGLVARTRILTYNWEAMLPTLRKYLPKTYVLAYDHSDFSYARVRLAAKLKASGYGVEARLTSVNLASFIKAKKLEVVPWNLSGAPAGQGVALSIFYGPKTYWFLTDDPAGQTKALKNQTAQLDWTAARVTTPLAAAVRVDRATYKAGKYRYPKVLGTALAGSARFALDTVTVSIAITKGAKGNYAYVGARGADASTRTKVKLPKGSGTVEVSVPVGDDGRIRIKTTKKSKLTVQVVASTTMSFS